MKWGRSTRRLLLITASSPREKLIKVGDNNNNKDYLCHYSYGNNSYGVLRGASGRNKYPPAFILQKTESSELFLFPPLCFSEKWSVGWWWVGGSFFMGEVRG